MRKILVLRGGALGDFIVTLPALALLRKRWPDARIEFVGNATAAELARRRGLIDTIHSQHEARWAALFGPGPLPTALVTSLQEFDLVLSYWPDPDGELAAHFPRRSGQTFLSASPMAKRAPAAAHYCEPLRKLGLTPGEFWYALKPLHPATRADSSVGRIAIHPGSGSPTKNWPAERWQELIYGVVSPVLLVLGEAEMDVWSAAVPKRPDIELAVSLPLEELITRFSTCARFVGHDSGISHLAAAVGLPCTLLFGPTEPAMWAPPAPHVRVIRRGPNLAAISVRDVQAELGE
jgi:heptosyltransferase III